MGKSYESNHPTPLNNYIKDKTETKETQEIPTATATATATATNTISTNTDLSSFVDINGNAICLKFHGYHNNFRKVPPGNCRWRQTCNLSHHPQLSVLTIQELQKQNNTLMYVSVKDNNIERALREFKKMDYDQQLVDAGRDLQEATSEYTTASSAEAEAKKSIAKLSSKIINKSKKLRQTIPPVDIDKLMEESGSLVKSLEDNHTLLYNLDPKT